LVLTAGHCAHGGPGVGFYTNFRFVPAFTNGVAPFGQWTVSDVFVSPVWSEDARVPNAEDWAILVMQDLNGQAIAEVTGRLSFKTNRLVPNHVKMLGYPVAFDGGQEMHQVDSGSLLLGRESTVVYGGDMTGGASGGPWVHNFGIKSSGQVEGRNRTINRVVGVSSYVVANDKRVLILGSSELNTNFRRLRRDACNDQSGNC
jgi:V8-like Glu-specific endopeptidase